MEGKGEPVDEEFLNEDFKREDVENPSQGFVDWDFPPAYDDNVSEVDSNERPLPSDLEEEDCCANLFNLHESFIV